MSVYDKAIILSEEWGITDPVWQYRCYEEVLESCLRDGVIILGGDIIVRKNGTYDYESSNWYYSGASVEESVNAARDYLSAYSADEDTFVAYVFK